MLQRYFSTTSRKSSFSLVTWKLCGRVPHLRFSTYQGFVSGEVTVIRKMASIHLIVYYPKTEAGKEELAKRVSDVHAAAVTQRLKSLNCPTQQKLDLLDAVIKTVRKKQGTDLM